MPKRMLGVVFAACLLATGCQEKPTPASLYQGSADVSILDNRYVTSNDSAAGMLGGGSQAYLVFKLHFVNNLSSQLFPIVTHFIFTTADGTRYNGSDSGSSALIGISNNYSQMKRGEERDFTIGFKVPYQQAGIITYEY